MSLADLIARVGQGDATDEDAATALRVLRAGWTWTRSARHALKATDFYLAVRQAGVPAARVVKATREAVALLGGWFVKRGNHRHVRGVRLNHMTDAEAWKASRHLRKPWRSTTRVVE